MMPNLTPEEEHVRHHRHRSGVCLRPGRVCGYGRQARRPLQPFEVVIIVGAAIGAMIVGNTKTNLGRIGKGFGKAAKGPSHSKDDYIELLSVQFQVFKLTRPKGMLALESHIENPDESDLFNQFPGFHENHHAVEFICDYLRMMSLGSESPHEMADLMEEEIETHHH